MRSLRRRAEVTSKLPLLVVLENAKDKVKGKNLIVALRRRIKCLPLFHYLPLGWKTLERYLGSAGSIHPRILLLAYWD
jgi:hypothetical protein